MNRIWLRRSIFNLRMLVVVVIILVIYFHELFINENFFGIDWNLNTTVDILELHLSVFAFSFFSITAGMFPGVPYGFSLLEERNSGYLRYELSRMSVDCYIWKKIFFVGISGAASMAIPYCILSVLIGMVGVPTTEAVHPDILESEIWGSILYIWDGYLVLFLHGVLIVLFGILWAELSLLISLFVRNKYIAFVLPFIIFELFWLLNREPFTTINPMYMLRANFDARSSTLAQPFLLFVVYILMTMLFCVNVFRKQVKNGKI